MSAVKTTVQVNFNRGMAGGYGGHLSAEIDTRPGGLNNGKSSFAPGDPVYILVYKSSGVNITHVIPSAGSIFQHGAVNVEITDALTFANERQATLSKPASGGLSVTWYGNSLGGLTLESDKTTVTASKSGVGVALVKYQAQARAYRLSTPLQLAGETSFEILVVVIGDDGNNG